jgi:hypothetical protein
MHVRAVAYTAPDQLVVHKHRTLVGRGRALEGDAQDRQKHGAAGEAIEPLAQTAGTVDGVVLVPVLDEPRGRRRLVFGTERDNQDVGLILGPVGDHAAGPRVDRGNQFLTKLDARSREFGVRDRRRLRRLVVEQDLHLGESEGERVVLIDEYNANLVGQRLRQTRGQLEPPEPGAENQYCSHSTSMCLFVVTMIVLSAIIAEYEAIRRLIYPVQVDNLGWVDAAGLIGFRRRKEYRARHCGGMALWV